MLLVDLMDLRAGDQIVLLMAVGVMGRRMGWDLVSLPLRHTRNDQLMKGQMERRRKRFKSRSQLRCG